ncbi:BT4734/BF3469 family protein [Pontibacter silvestris]|uniref:BT4734/BF3469 family protein n=1 Tax=Pontibacter silvestris TaxID=2305183 RepID=A0ABW4X210_9BACT|nr:BT4734/BF3469 family protein [Pontibacter silvestris]MCC9134988.1 PriCT-2 domain-containing protein [Pontibacter silvestris]
MDKGLINHNLCPVPEVGRDRARNSVLDVKVSCFASYTTPTNSVSINLLTWLSSAKYRLEVEKIRATEDKSIRDSLKSRLPAITPSGIFSARNEKSLIKHSGLIQFDIDLKENRQIGNFYELKQQLSNIPNVAYCGLSVSGQGFWGLIPIAFTDKHKEHFRALRKAFLQMGIIVDEKPKNVASLRGYSFDPEPYFNHQAIMFKLNEAPLKQKGNSYSNLKTLKSFTSSIKDKVEACIAEIERTGVDITSSYAAWFEIGCSLASEFGENARGYFHQISQYHPEYSYTKTDMQFNRCLKGGYNFSIGTFFMHCNNL